MDKEEMYEKKEELEIKYDSLNTAYKILEKVLNELEGIEEIDEDDYSELEIIWNRIEDKRNDIDNKIADLTEQIENEESKKIRQEEEIRMNESFERSRL